MVSEEGVILKLGELIKNYVRKIFIEQFAENVHQKVVHDLYLLVVNTFNARNIVNASKKLLKEDYEKFTKNLTQFFFEPTLFLMGIMKNKMGLELVTIFFSGCQVYSGGLF